MTGPITSTMREIAPGHERAPSRHHVVVVAAGFGGLKVAQGLAGSGVDITVIDRRNHHLFQPLLYQGASLSTSEIAWPIRSFFRKRKDVRTLLGEVEDVDTERRRVFLDDGSAVAYDTLVIATGARHSYFGHDQWKQFAPGLKSLEVPTHPDIFVIVDTAATTGADGKAVPGLAPAAKQAGQYVARLIRQRLKEVSASAPFRYRHQGNLATIGRSLLSSTWPLQIARSLGVVDVEVRSHLFLDRSTEPAQRRAKLDVGPWAGILWLSPDYF